jgi:hypothetical protein
MLRNTWRLRRGLRKLRLWIELSSLVSEARPGASSDEWGTDLTICEAQAGGRIGESATCRALSELFERPDWFKRLLEKWIFKSRLGRVCGQAGFEFQPLVFSFCSGTVRLW